MRLVITSTTAQAQVCRSRGLQAVTAEQFLAGSELPHAGPLAIDNQAGPFTYLSAGYYCSLAAEARGLAIAPTVRTICDHWHRAAPTPATGSRLAERIAILHEAETGDAPSDSRSSRFVHKLARRHGIETEIIGPADLSRLGEFGGLWIRCLTDPLGIGYVFAMRAEELGIPVLDDSVSILRCCNKVFAAERLARAGIATPRTVIVGEATPIAAIEAALAYPMVLKGPDGSFSRSVVKAGDRAALMLHIGTLRARSHLILAQEFMPTAFDWRVGVLAGRPLFACKYRMARGHWQILKHRDGLSPMSGRVSCVHLEDAPRGVLATAVAAAQAMGDGLYGVDLKQTADGVFVIEVNDNPDINRGIEDRAEGERLWLDILGWFRLQQMRRLTHAPTLGEPVLRAALG